ncbi:MAG TPA: endonuclease domain-containing protein [Paracoccaceae bacterium]|nr:endonuclease domain-containing protein [Paracoccaceae bacterium]HMO71062.1 endonuclease domain-containing protein [Paracoccaceae bacterium]
MSRIAPDTRDLARRLRHAMTPHERQLWQHLRGVNRMLGTNFRRQAPVGRYVLDFADLGRRLAVEVDGGQHADRTQAERDLRRDDWLAAEGFTVLRVWNADVAGNVEGVMQAVLDALGVGADGAEGVDPPPPYPSPTRGEGSTSAAGVAHRCPGSASPPPCGEGMGVGGHGRRKVPNP